MAAKKLQVSADNITFYTLPGSQGQYTEEMNSNTDTVFGQNYESKEVGLAEWQVTADSIFKGLSGYTATLKKQGTPTTMTAEAMTLVSGKTYRITNAAKQIIDYFTTLTVLDNAVDQTANVLSIDYLTGAVTFKAAYTPTTPITITGKYIPTVAIASGKAWNVNQTASEIDNSSYDTAQANGGWRTFDSGLLTVAIDITNIFALANGWSATLTARSVLVVEISPDGGTTLFRGYFKVINRNQSGNVGALEEEKLTLNLWVPDGALVVRPFGWVFGSGTTLNLAIQTVINGFFNQTNVYIKYLPDGGTTANAGKTGQCVVTQANLANTVEGINTFQFTFRGDGAPTAV